MHRKSTLIQLAVLLGLASTITADSAPSSSKLWVPNGFNLTQTAGPSTPPSSLPQPSLFPASSLVREQALNGSGLPPQLPNSTVARPPPASSSPPAPPGSPPSFTPKRRASLDTPRYGQPAAGLKKRAGFNSSTASLDDYASYALEVAKSRIANSTTCTAENLTVRKLWDNMSSTERVNYTDALLCLMDKPAKTPSDLAPGAKTRYDDWVVTHINQTLSIHCTANFLGWHRWFTWSMEQALRDECGYTGAVPYWDWTKTEQEGFANSQLFDGSATSLSGNGSPLNYTDADEIVINANTSAEVVLPHGTGGGCVTSGPFANMTVNLGPDALLVMDSTTADNASYPYQYNPRCLKRDFTDEILHRWNNDTSVRTLLAEPTIRAFESTMQGSDTAPELGVHGGGHYATGGDPGRDFYVSPGDPIFWSHHANIDRVWWMWQMLDPDARTSTAITTEAVTAAIDGPLTMYDLYEPHGNGTAADLQNLGYVAEGQEVALGSLMSTTEGMFCYVYE